MWTDIVPVTGTPTNPPSLFDLYTVQSSDIGKLLVCSPTNNLEITIPAGLPQGDFGLIREDNGPSFIKIVPGAGVTIPGRAHIVHPMQNDARCFHVKNDVAYPWASGQVPDRGPGGQHRTVVASNFPNQSYAAHEGDIGAVIRVNANTWAMNVVLPDAPVIGTLGGYGGGARLGVMSSPASSYNVQVIARTGSAVNGTNIFVLPKKSRVYWFDFDSAEWFLDGTEDI